MTPPLPPFDPLGLPLPAVLLQVLAYLTLTLHLFAMQFSVGSAVLLGLSLRHAGRARVARFLGTGLPLGFSYLVTFGIPPLLFVQVMYGQFFYSSSVLIGAFWIAVIPLLIVAYGASYWHKLTRASRPRPQPWIVALALLAMLAVGFIYVNNLTLSMTPERWLQLYTAHPGGGTLNLGERTLWPRYLLVLSPGLAVAGIALVVRGGLLRAWGEAAEGEGSQRLGLRAMLVSAGLVALAAVGLFATLPEAVGAAVKSGGALTWLAAASALLVVSALALAWRAGKRAGLLVPLLAALAQLGATACAVILRDLVRHEYLRPHFQLDAAAVRPQWGMFALFAAVLAAGLVFLVVYTRKTVASLVAAHHATGNLPASELAG